MARYLLCSVVLERNTMETTHSDVDRLLDLLDRGQVMICESKALCAMARVTVERSQATRVAAKKAWAGKRIRFTRRLSRPRSRGLETE